MAQLKNGLQVDLQRFNSVRFDPATQLLTVGGAVKFSQVIEPLAASGYQFREWPSPSKSTRRDGGCNKY